MRLQFMLNAGPYEHYKFSYYYYCCTMSSGKKLYEYAYTDNIEY